MLRGFLEEHLVELAHVDAHGDTRRLMDTDEWGVWLTSDALATGT
jgi:hypothetical protein